MMAAAERVRAVLPAEKGSFPDALKALRSTWGWPEVWDGVQEHLDAAVQGASVERLAQLVSGASAQTAATGLAQDTWDRVYLEFFNQRENEFLLNLLLSVVLVWPAANAVDVSNVSADQAFTLAAEGEVFRAFEVPDSVVGEMIDSELDHRRGAL